MRPQEGHNPLTTTSDAMMKLEYVSYDDLLRAITLVRRTVPEEELDEVLEILGLDSP